MNTPGGWAAEQLALHFMIVRKPPYNRDKQEGSSTEKGDSQQKKQEEEDEKWGMGVRKNYFKKAFKMEGWQCQQFSHELYFILWYLNRLIPQKHEMDAWDWKRRHIEIFLDFNLLPKYKAHIGVAVCACMASDTLIEEATDSNSSLSPCRWVCSSAWDRLPTEPPGTEQLGLTSGRWSFECQRKADKPLWAPCANWYGLVWSNLAVVRLSSMAGLGRVWDHKITTSCQHLGSFHMFSSECPCQLYELCHI